MGKFGKFKLPEFVLKKFGPGITDEDNATLTEERISGEDSADENQNNEQEMTTELEKHKVFESFQDFQSHVAETPIGEDEDQEQEDNTEEVNEEDMLKEPEEMTQPCEGCSDHPDTLSENAKNAIKQICNEILIKEAHLYETSEDPNQTYETFLKECTHYMAECLIRASQNLKV
jgi:hypothetical protein